MMTRVTRPQDSTNYRLDIRRTPCKLSVDVTQTPAHHKRFLTNERELSQVGHFQRDESIKVARKQKKITRRRTIANSSNSNRRP